MFCLCAEGNGLSTVQKGQIMGRDVLVVAFLAHPVFTPIEKPVLARVYVISAKLTVFMAPTTSDNAVRPGVRKINLPTREYWVVPGPFTLCANLSDLNPFFHFLSVDNRYLICFKSPRPRIHGLKEDPVPNPLWLNDHPYVICLPAAIQVRKTRTGKIGDRFF